MTIKIYLLCFLLAVNTFVSAQWSETNASYDASISSLPVSDKLLITGTRGDGVFYLENQSSTWINISPPITGISARSFATVENDFFVGTNKGIFKLEEDGINWVPRNEGLTDSSINTLLTKGNTIYAGNIDGVFRSSDYGKLWTSVSNGLTTSWVLCLGSLDTVLFAGTVNGGIFRSFDNGENWMPANNGLPIDNIRCFAANETHIFVGGGQAGFGLYYSTNYGDEWFGTNLNRLVNSIVILGDRIFAASYFGSVYVSDDNGLTWAFSGSGITQLDLRCLTVSAGDIFLGTAGGIYGEPLGGVFHSSDNGASWLSIGEGLPDAGIGSLSVFNEYLFAGVYSNGIWKKSLNVTSFDYNSSTIPEEFLLLQNFPNPFNPSTTISWDMPIEGHQSLKVFDVLGNEVATLVDEFRPAGKYEVSFDASNLASGIYIYRLHAGDPSAGSGQGFIQTRKMILMK